MTEGQHATLCVASVFFYVVKKMIIKVDNCHYSKVNNIELKSNTFTLYIQCFKKFNNNKDIYEFKTDTSKVYVSSSTVAKVFVPDFSSLNTPIDTLIASAIDESDCKNVKFVFVAY